MIASFRMKAGPGFVLLWNNGLLLFFFLVCYSFYVGFLWCPPIALPCQLCDENPGDNFMSRVAVSQSFILGGKCCYSGPCSAPLSCLRWRAPNLVHGGGRVTWCACRLQSRTVRPRGLSGGGWGSGWVGCDLIDRLLSILTPRWSKEGEGGNLEERERILWNQSGNEDQGVVRSCEAPRAVL